MNSLFFSGIKQVFLKAGIQSGHVVTVCSGFFVDKKEEAEFLVPFISTAISHIEFLNKKYEKYLNP